MYFTSFSQVPVIPDWLGRSWAFSFGCGCRVGVRKLGPASWIPSCVVLKSLFVCPAGFSLSVCLTVRDASAYRGGAVSCICMMHLEQDLECRTRQHFNCCSVTSPSSHPLVRDRFAFHCCLFGFFAFLVFS